MNLHKNLAVFLLPLSKVFRWRKSAEIHLLLKQNYF